MIAAAICYLGACVILAGLNIANAIREKGN